LRELARQALADAAESPQNRGHALALEADSAIQAQGDPLLAQVLLRNLLDNALRYSPRGSAVQVRLQPAGAGGLRWSVGDEGPGMDAADIARLGERFFRVSQAAAPGSGLGWSIVRRIAAAHGVELQVTARQPTGLEVAVLFPRIGA
jgi:two-component system sensor histidine kinase QseC